MSYNYKTGFDKDNFEEYVYNKFREVASDNVITVMLLENITTYAIRHENHNTNELFNFLNEMFPELKPEEISKYFSDRQNLTNVETEKTPVKIPSFEQLQQSAEELKQISEGLEKMAQNLSNQQTIDDNVYDDRFEY